MAMLRFGAMCSAAFIGALACYPAMAAEWTVGGHAFVSVLDDDNGSAPGVGLSASKPLNPRTRVESFVQLRQSAGSRNAAQHGVNRVGASVLYELRTLDTGAKVFARAGLHGEVDRSRSEWRNGPQLHGGLGIEQRYNNESSGRAEITRFGKDSIAVSAGVLYHLSGSASLVQLPSAMSDEKAIENAAALVAGLSAAKQSTAAIDPVTGGRVTSFDVFPGIIPVPNSP